MRIEYPIRTDRLEIKKKELPVFSEIFHPFLIKWAPNTMTDLQYFDDNEEYFIFTYKWTNLYLDIVPNKEKPHRLQPILLYLSKFEARPGDKVLWTDGMNMICAFNPKGMFRL